MMCATCPAGEEHEPSAWFSHIWFLYQLQQAGYPFGRDELTLDEWLGLAELKAALETTTEPETWPTVPE